MSEVGRESFLGLPSIDIGAPRKIVWEDSCYMQNFAIHTDRGVFYHASDKSWRAYQFGFELVKWGDPQRPLRAWAMAESMSLIGSIARLEHDLANRLAPGEEVPLLSDEEGWEYMLRNKFPQEPKEAWQWYERATWIDVDGRPVPQPDWFRSYWVRLLYHRQSEWAG